MRRMRAYIIVLVLSLIVGFSFGNSQQSRAVHNGKPRAVIDKASKPVDCADPNGYSVEEATEPGTHSVNIVRDGRVLHTIKLLTDVERNGFGFDGVKKTKEGFELAIEYGSRIFYGKRFIFICRHHTFYLSKIGVDSFDRQNPEKWNRKVIRVQPNLPLEKFFITDFMREGVVK
jgi:hypothetical protein